MQMAVPALIRRLILHSQSTEQKWVHLHPAALTTWPNNQKITIQCAGARMKGKIINGLFKSTVTNERAKTILGKLKNINHKKIHEERICINCIEKLKTFLLHYTYDIWESGCLSFVESGYQLTGRGYFLDMWWWHGVWRFMTFGLIRCFWRFYCHNVMHTVRFDLIPLNAKCNYTISCWDAAYFGIRSTFATRFF